MKGKINMKVNFLICRKEVKSSNGGMFYRYFGYKYLNDNGKYTDISNGKSFKIVFTKNCRDKCLSNIDNVKFPIMAEVDANEDFFITYDKDKNKKPRLDKEGNKYLLCVINNIKTYNPYKTNRLTIDNL